MKYKFNPYERFVGIFITFALGGSLIVGVGVAVKKNWFNEKISYVTYTNSASNLREGSSVLMAGLKVGKIEKIELDPVHSIKVTFSVWKEYTNQITEGAKVQFVRPFVIGDKVLTVIHGKSEGKVIPPGEALALQDSVDLMDVISGNKLQAVLARVDSILTNLDETLVLGKDIALQVGDKKQLQKTMENLTYASGEVRKVLPHLTARAPAASAQLLKTIENLSIITTSLREIQPEGSRKTIELLNESVVTLQAMQKSFFLRSNVKEVKAEMAAKEKEKNENRAPASIAPSE